MLGEDLSRALSHISDDKIEAAAHVMPKSRGHIWMRAAAVAAVIAIVLTALLWPAEDESYEGVLGVVKVYAYDTLSGTDIENMDRFELTDIVDGNRSFWIPYGSMVTKIPLTLECDASQYENADIKFSVSVNWGRFSHFVNERTETGKIIKVRENLGANFTVANGETIWWDPTFTVFNGQTVSINMSGSDERVMQVIETDGGVFADILIYADGHLIGYAVIEFIYAAGTPAFISIARRAECFPMIDGEYQEITEEEIKEMISSYR